MNKHRLHAIALLALLFGFTPLAHAQATQDWPQWRGPDRNGIAADSPALASSWTETESGKPPLLWEANILPRESGESSPVIADGNIFVFANAPKDEDSPTRTLDQRFYSKIQWFDPHQLPADLLEKIETTRLALPDLPRKKLRNWIETWVEEHMPVKQRGLAKRRLLKGIDNVSPAGMTLLKNVRNRTFGNESIFLNWLDDNEVTDEDRELILAALPEGKRTAKDVVFCLDLKTGEPLWETRFNGRPESRMGSSTPTVDVAAKAVYLFGTTHAHALDMASGETLWSTELPNPANASSPILTDDHLIGLVGHLVAFDRKTGKLAWEVPSLRGKKSSPVFWRTGNARLPRLLVKAESAKTLACVNPTDGTIHWQIPSNGDSTPVVFGNILVLHEKTRASAYRLFENRTEPLWTHDFIDTRGASSPIIYNDTVLIFPTTGAVCLHLQTGAVVWEDGFKSGIISPILADGNVLYPSNGGQFLTIFDPATGAELSKTRLASSRCSSPALSNGFLILRTKNSITAHNLRAPE